MVKAMNLDAEELLGQLQAKIRGKGNAAVTRPSGGLAKEIFDHYIPLMAPNVDPDRWVLMDERTGFVVEGNVARLDSAKEIIKTFGKEAFAEWWNRAFVAETIFNPYRPRKDTDIKDRIVNLFRPLEWMNAEPEPLDPIFDKILTHLFPEHLPFVAAWVANSLRGKNLTALILLSEQQGTGKGTFLNILEALHSFNNSKLVDGKQSVATFNSLLWRSTLIGWDEAILLSDEALSYWKTAITEPRIKFELKKVDSFVDDNHCNIVMTTNDPSHIRMDPKDRRWSCPVVTETPLLSILTAKQVSDFKKHTLQNPRQLKALYLYLQELADKSVGHATQLKDTPPFWRFCKESNSQRKWLLDLIEETRNGRYTPRTHPIPRADLEKAYKRAFPHSSFPLIGHSKLVNFFRLYAPNGKPVAKVSSDGHLEVIGFNPTKAMHAL
jgi:hypothetical protein